MLIECECQIEVQFIKYKVESAVDEAMKMYLLKMKTKLEALIDKQNVSKRVVSFCINVRVKFSSKCM